MKKTFILIIIFLVIGSYIIISAYNINLDEKEGRKTFIFEAGKWVIQLGKSAKNAVTYAVKQDWLPEINETEPKSKTYEIYGE